MRERDGALRAAVLAPCLRAGLLGRLPWPKKEEEEAGWARSLGREKMRVLFLFLFIFQAF